MAAQLPSTAKSSLGATAPDLHQSSLDALISQIAELNTVSSRDRAPEARAMLDMGKALSVLKEALPHGAFQYAVRELGINTSTASRYMRAVLRLDEHVPQDVLEQFLAIGKAGLLELLSVDDEALEALALTGEYCGLRLDELPSMSVMKIRRAVKSINEDDEQVHALLREKGGEIDFLCDGDLQVGDVVESRYSKRPGRAVKIYPDGSASVCWHDGEPQPEGMGHERMPRELLRLVERPAPLAAPAPEPEADPARVKAHIEIAAILAAIASKAAPAAPVPAPAQNPLPTDTAAGPENVICLTEARRQMAEATNERPARGRARLLTYCAELVTLLASESTAAELEDLATMLEEMIADLARGRPLPALVAARYALFCRIWLEGGAK